MAAGGRRLCLTAASQSLPEVWGERGSRVCSRVSSPGITLACVCYRACERAFVSALFCGVPRHVMVKQTWSYRTFHFIGVISRVQSMWPGVK